MGGVEPPRSAEGCCLQPARERGWFLQYQLITGALHSSCQLCPRKALSTALSGQCFNAVVPFSPHTKHPCAPPPGALSNLAEVV